MGTLDLLLDHRRRRDASCDFCLAPKTTPAGWVLLHTPDLEIGFDGGPAALRTDWICCGDCDRDVRLGNRSAMAERVANRFFDRWGPAGWTRTELVAALERMFAAGHTDFVTATRTDLPN